MKKKSLLQFGEKEIAKKGLVGGGTQISHDPQQPVVVWGQALILKHELERRQRYEARRKKNKLQTLNYDLS